MWKKSLAIGLAGTLLAMSGAWASDAYPSKPVRFLVGYSPGGPTDVVARVVAEGLGNALKQTFIVENKPGAGGTIAAAEVAKARPDGYTMLFSGVNHSLNPAMFDKLPFDSMADFTPVAAVANTPSLLVVRPDFPAANYQELMALVRQHPGKYSVACTSGTKFTADLFMHEAGADLLTVVYKGAAPAMTDVMGGHADMSFATLGSVLPMLEAGKLRAIAIAADQRIDALPDVPTFRETGLEGFRLDGWFGVLLPAGAPEDVVKTVRDGLVALAATPAFKERIRPYGIEPVLDSEPAAFKAQIAQEIDMYQSLGKKIGAEKFN